MTVSASKIIWRLAIGVVAAGVVAGATATSVVFWDRQVALLLHHAQSPALIDVAELISALGSPVSYFVPSGIAFLYFLLSGGNKLHQNQALFVLLASTNSAFWTDMLKFIVGRSRPNLFVEKSIYAVHPLNNAWAFNSFPSDHAAVAAAMAMTFSLLVPTYRPTFFLLAALVCAGRVYMGVHFVSDIIVGALIGIAAEIVIRFVFDRYQIALRPGTGHPVSTPRRVE